MHPKQYWHYALLLLIPALLAIHTRAQSFNKLDNWMEENTPALGGRSMLLIYKDGHIVYSKAVNMMSPIQKLGNRWMARRQGKKANIEDYDANTRLPIA